MKKFFTALTMLVMLSVGAQAATIGTTIHLNTDYSIGMFQAVTASFTPTLDGTLVVTTFESPNTSAFMFSDPDGSSPLEASSATWANEGDNEDYYYIYNYTVEADVPVYMVIDSFNMTEFHVIFSKEGEEDTGEEDSDLGFNDSVTSTGDGEEQWYLDLNPYKEETPDGPIAIQTNSPTDISQFIKLENKQLVDLDYPAEISLVTVLMEDGKYGYNTAEDQPYDKVYIFSYNGTEEIVFTFLNTPVTGEVMSSSTQNTVEDLGESYIATAEASVWVYYDENGEASYDAYLLTNNENDLITDGNLVIKGDGAILEELEAVLVNGCYAYNLPINGGVKYTFEFNLLEDQEVEFSLNMGSAGVSTLGFANLVNDTIEAGDDESTVELMWNEALTFIEDATVSIPISFIGESGVMQMIGMLGVNDIQVETSETSTSLFILTGASTLFNEPGEYTMIITGGFLKNEEGKVNPEQTISVTAKGDTDGISSITSTNGGSTIYNMQGVKVNNPTKGLYIINGKKVIVK